jgi:hypothetical protein|tara:strand:+ start:337 stop:1245 length:909 start_codon:yes stop_codon:yes gene_type:complete
MSKKLIAKISEGLGNQLFMYANAFSLSKKINYNLFIDDESGYDSKSIRSFDLNNFNITANIAANDLKFNNHKKKIIKKLLIFFDKFTKNKNFIIELRDQYKKTAYYDYINDISLNDNIFIEGYFESEKYFLDQKKSLQKEFSLKNENIYQDNRYINDIINKNVVSICVRQNRFSERLGNHSNPLSLNKSKSFVKDTIDYIKKAENLIETKISNPIYYLWSNDFTNLREYFPENKYKFIINNKNKILSDFYLLKNCKYFIVGPSTFHWWGAWLSDYNDKICIRPKHLNPSTNSNFWPNNWIDV